MKNSENDLRVIKTKKAIKRALSELIVEKGFDSISITDLTLRARINRGTFYLHYVDKYDLLEKIEDDVLEDIYINAKIFINRIESSDFLKIDLNSELFPFITKILNYIKDNEIIMKVILGPKSDTRFRKKIKIFFYDLIKGKQIEKLFDSAENPLSKEYFISYLLGAHIGIAQQWMESGMNEPAEKISVIVSQMFFTGPLNYLRNNIGTIK